LRVNVLKQTREDFIKILNRHKISATPCSFSIHGLTLDTPLPAEEIPGFKEGYFFIQDEAAQLATQLLLLKPNLRILDACAAPGGKTTHILETEPKLSKLIAIDQDKKRLHKISENLTRLQLSTDLIHGDAARPETWWDKKGFDRILLDAPCSATGVIRRHPDIKLLRQATDIQTLAQKQLALLQALWPLLNPGGYLLYVTCSLLPDENQQIIAQFLSEHPTAQMDPLHTPWGLSVNGGTQILPGTNNMDGFYFQRLKFI